MIYSCKDCGFLFFRLNEAKECPSCEKKHIRLASHEEIQKLKMLLEKRAKSLSKKK